MKRKLAVLITTLAIGALALIAIPSVSAEPALNEQETIFVAKLAAGSPPSFRLPIAPHGSWLNWVTRLPMTFGMGQILATNRTTWTPVTVIVLSPGSKTQTWW